MKRTGLLVLLLGGVAMAGCLKKESTHTLYLSPSGTVDWVVVEANVHSDEEDAGKRFAEEQAYLGPALTGRHPAVDAMRALGALGPIGTTVVRDERPFHVITQARLPRIDAVVDRLLHELGIKGRASYTTSDGVSTLVVWFDFSQDIDDKGSPVARLFEESSHVMLVLSDGRFDESAAFDVADGVKATISEPWLQRAMRAIDARSSIELRLTWRALEHRP